jgi:hypothetical protein
MKKENHTEDKDAESGYALLDAGLKHLKKYSVSSIAYSLYYNHKWDFQYGMIVAYMLKYPNKKLTERGMGIIQNKTPKDYVKISDSENRLFCNLFKLYQLKMKGKPF